MNIAVVEPTSTSTQASDRRDGGLPKTSHQTEWIDPECTDWFASIYRELTEQPATTTIDERAPELEHWFG